MTIDITYDFHLSPLVSLATRRQRQYGKFHPAALTTIGIIHLPSVVNITYNHYRLGPSVDDNKRQYEDTDGDHANFLVHFILLTGLLTVI